MEHDVVVADACAVRAVIARRLAPPADSVTRLGGVVLRPHQRAAVRLVGAALDRAGGALLADDVGLGKTYAALAVARESARTLVLAPAALREMWGAALAATGVGADIISYEALSRRWTPDGAYDLVIADEAHHLRNPRTRRYRAAAAAANGARVLLLSATPIHNRAADLRSLLAIFLGERANALTASELAAYVVRRARGDAVATADMPAVTPAAWIPVGDDEDLLEALRALPSPVPASDAGHGGALLTYSLLRLWASSRGALRQGLRRRLALASALGDALERGLHPTRAELSAWHHAADSLQLAFPELVASGAVANRDALLAAVRVHARAVRELLDWMGPGPGPDAARAEALRRIRAGHPGRKIVAFSQYADTVRALLSALRGDAHVGALTASGGTIAGGALSRAELLARFAPRAQGRSPPRQAERVELLLTTDLLSEGVNLQDASIVVHLDLPWTVARLDQRVGRAARIGAGHATVDVFALAPPARSEVVLGIERTLRAKLHTAALEIGVTGAPLPDAGVRVDSSAPSQAERVRRVIARWHLVAPRAAPVERAPSAGASIVATAVRSEHAGLLALLEEDGHPRLVAAMDGEVSDDPALVARAADLADGDAVGLGPEPLRAALARVERWLDQRRTAAAADLHGTTSGRLRRILVARIARILRAAPYHQQPRLALLAEEARRVVRATLGAGAERQLAELAEAPLPDEAWLRAVVSCARRSVPDPPDAGLTRLLALIVLSEG